MVSLFRSARGRGRGFVLASEPSRPSVALPTVPEDPCGVEEPSEGDYLDDSEAFRRLLLGNPRRVRRPAQEVAPQVVPVVPWPGVIPAFSAGSNAENDALELQFNLMSCAHP